MTVTRRVIISDPGDEQTHLFEPASTLPKKCSACKATRDEQCAYDLRDIWGNRRPDACLLRYDPRNGVIPF